MIDKLFFLSYVCEYVFSAIIMSNSLHPNSLNRQTQQGIFYHVGYAMVDPVTFVENTLDTIWNQKMVGAIYETFAPGIRVHRSSQEELYGQESLMVEIVERLAAFPDLRLTIENIIWQGSAEQGYRVSVRMNFAGHNLGVSRYGAATHREFQQAALMDGRIMNGRFVEIWVAEDERSLVEQLGHDPLDAMRSLETLDLFAGKSVMFDTPASMSDVRREQSSRLSLDDIATLQLASLDAVQQVLSALWNERQIGVCERFYRDDFTCHWASNRQLTGRADYQAVVLGQLAAFPDLTFHVDDLIEQQRDDGWHVAVSWMMLGTHAGPSAYGIPSGKHVQIGGISQYVIQNQKFVSERTEWNEFRLIQKIMVRPVVYEQQEDREFSPIDKEKDHD